jgi:hypothetical protein
MRVVKRQWGNRVTGITEPINNQSKVPVLLTAIVTQLIRRKVSRSNLQVRKFTWTLSTTSGNSWGGEGGLGSPCTGTHSDHLWAAGLPEPQWLILTLGTVTSSVAEFSPSPLYPTLLFSEGYLLLLTSGWKIFRQFVQIDKELPKDDLIAVSHKLCDISVLNVHVRGVQCTHTYWSPKHLSFLCGRTFTILSSRYSEICNTLLLTLVTLPCNGTPALLPPTVTLPFDPSPPPGSPASGCCYSTVSMRWTMSPTTLADEGTEIDRDPRAQWETKPD